MRVQISDVVVPAEFTNYIVENSLTSTALFQSGVAVRNGVMESQLSCPLRLVRVSESSRG
jgi:hypothetical protein